LKRSVS